MHHRHHQIGVIFGKHDHVFQRQHASPAEIRQGRFALKSRQLPEGRNRGESGHRLSPRGEESSHGGGPQTAKKSLVPRGIDIHGEIEFLAERAHAQPFVRQARLVVTSPREYLRGGDLATDGGKNSRGVPQQQKHQHVTGGTFRGGNRMVAGISDNRGGEEVGDTLISPRFWVCEEELGNRGEAAVEKQLVPRGGLAKKCRQKRGLVGGSLQRHRQ